MSGEEERSLLHRWRAERDRRALARLVDEHRSRVERIAMAFTRFGVAREDLEQEGLVGLLTAIARFDAACGRRLADYATAWMRLQMVHFAVASLAPLRPGVRRVAVAESIGRTSCSLDDARARSSVGALADPAPNAEERIAAAEEESERERSLAARLALLTPDERAAIERLQLAANDDGAAADGEAEWRALAKLLAAPGDDAGEVHVLVGGRRRRLQRDGGRRGQTAAFGGG